MRIFLASLNIKRIVFAKRLAVTSDILNEIIKNLSAGTGKMFKSKQLEECKMTKKMKQEFKAALNEMRKCQLGSIGQMNCQLYEAIVYKFGPSNRHQIFWRMALRIYRMMKKLNEHDLIGPFCKFSQKLEKSGCFYYPAKKFICYLGALLLRRLSLLDKMLFLCGRSADASMGYIELRHMLTFNLMSIAMLSEISSQAIRQMNQLVKIYLQLSIWFREYSKKFPSTTDQIQRMLTFKIEDTDKKARILMNERDLAIFYRQIGDPTEETADLSSKEYVQKSQNKRRKLTNYE